MIETLAQIHAAKPRAFTAGIILHDDRVVDAAPIVRYMQQQKWTRLRVRNYCAEKGWTVEVVYELAKP